MSEFINNLRSVTSKYLTALNQMTEGEPGKAKETLEDGIEDIYELIKVCEAYEEEQKKTE